VSAVRGNLLLPTLMVQDISKDCGSSFFQNVCSRKLLATATLRNPNNVLYYRLVIQIIVVTITLRSVLWFKLPTVTLVTELGSPVT